MIRALVVEDSVSVRKHLVDCLEVDPEIKVVGEATDGESAIAACTALRPDVVTMDLVLPGVDGIAAIEHIMAYVATPILVVSSADNRGELFHTYEALAAGALSALEKPPRVDAAWEKRFRAEVKLISRLRVIHHPRAKLGFTASRGAAPARAARGAEVARLSKASTNRRCDVVAIGASTGGPAAVAALLKGLSPDFSTPILLLVHMGPPFGFTFPEWLHSLSPIPVRAAVDGESIPHGRGVVLVAPPDKHLVVERGRLRLSAEVERNFCRPSVDVLFESVAREAGPPALGCLLTGMGRDGALGLLALRRAGGVTIAQDEASSVIFGMPREAIALGAAELVLPLDAIATAISSYAGKAEASGA